MMTTMNAVVVAFKPSTPRTVYTLDIEDDLTDAGRSKLIALLREPHPSRDTYELHLAYPAAATMKIETVEDAIIARIVNNQKWFAEQEAQLLKYEQEIVVQNKLQKGDAHEKLIQTFLKRLLAGSTRVVGKFQIITNASNGYDPQSDVVVCRGGAHVSRRELKNIGVAVDQVLAVIESKTILTKQEALKAARELRSLTDCPCGVFAFAAGNSTNQAKVSKISTICKWVHIAFSKRENVKIVIVAPRTHTHPTGDGIVFLRDRIDAQKWRYMIIPATNTTMAESRGAILLSLVYAFAEALEIGDRFVRTVDALFAAQCEKVMIEWQYTSPPPPPPSSSPPPSPQSHNPKEISSDDRPHNDESNRTQSGDGGGGGGGGDDNEKKQNGFITTLTKEGEEYEGENEDEDTTTFNEIEKVMDDVFDRCILQ